MRRKSFFRYVSAVLILSVFSSGVVFAVEDPARALEFMEQGEKYISDFYNPNKDDYFGKKIETFFEDGNMKVLQTKIEKVAKDRNKSTKEVLTEVSGEEFTKKVFGDLSYRLAALQYKYKHNFSLNVDISDPSMLDAIALGAGTLVGTLGVSAAVIGIWAGMTATVTGLWAALVIWWTGASIGWEAAIAAILSGPWGWIVLGGMVIASIVGYTYYQRKAEAHKAEMKKRLYVEIEAMRATLVSNWRKSFE